MPLAALEEEINIQRSKFLAPPTHIHLYGPCVVGNGIYNATESECEHFRSTFRKDSSPVSFFIPASGAGSRMFDFLHQYIQDPETENLPLVERFLRNLREFAFFEKIAPEMINSFEAGETKINDFLKYLLNKEGLNLSSLPKGLIPFHKFDSLLLNPVQEHLLQGDKLKGKQKHFHFTIQQEFLQQFEKSISSLEKTGNSKYSYSFSFQDPATDSFTFDSDGTLLTDENGKPLMRPSGHGALLGNLTNIPKGIVFIKNIDNIQHLNKSQDSLQAMEFLGGMLLEIKKMAFEVFKNPTESALQNLNQKYQLFDPSELADCRSQDQIRKLLQRPFRVCGMVKNQGQPGGGPFWVESNGRITKQIVEKAQIASNNEQLELMMRSTHFNPVFMALDLTDFSGNNYDLQHFVAQEMYFKVSKTNNGKSLGYIEMPGLWNGSMAYWNTLFVELPSSVFSPVKSVLDLIEKPHLSE